MKYMPLRCVLIFDVQHTAFNLTAESRMGRDETRERNNGRMEWREGEMVVRGEGGGWKTKPFTSVGHAPRPSAERMMHD